MPDAGSGSPREALRAELEATRAAFHALLREVSNANWDRSIALPPWTTGEILVHVTFYLTFVIPRGVDAARKGKRWGGLPPLIAHSRVADWLNTYATRRRARLESPRTIGQTYDAAHLATLQLLDSIRDDEWSTSTYTLGRQMTIAEIFGAHASHFHEHAPQIQAALR